MNKDVRNILNLLNNNDFQAYIVGGYPRDIILNRYTNDYDICTNAKPEDLVKIFNFNIISNNYGSLKINYNNQKYEITTFRKENNYINHRKPELVEFVNDLKIDLMRRDFTINTICMNADGNIIDLLNGIDDIKNKTIRVVGNADFKIKQDSLRILRAIRFATILNFKLDEELTNSIKKYGYLIKEISMTRKKEELDKIFSSDNIFYGLKLLKELNLDEYLDIDISDVRKTSLIGIWAQVNPYKYKFSKNELQMINKINELKCLNILDNYNLYKYGLEISLIAGEIKNISKDKIIDKYNELPIKIRKDIDINIIDIRNNINNDSTISSVIGNIEQQILDNKLINKQEIILKYLKETYL